MREISTSRATIAASTSASCEILRLLNSRPSIFRRLSRSPESATRPCCLRRHCSCSIANSSPNSHGILRIHWKPSRQTSTHAFPRPGSGRSTASRMGPRWRQRGISWKPCNRIPRPGPRCANRCWREMNFDMLIRLQKTGVAALVRSWAVALANVLRRRVRPPVHLLTKAATERFESAQKTVNNFPS